jgi:hypothetical protein
MIIIDSKYRENIYNKNFNVYNFKILNVNIDIIGLK